MNKETYLQTLRAKLTGNIGPREIDDAIAYYSEYFEDAGPEPVSYTHLDVYKRQP